MILILTITRIKLKWCQAYRVAMFKPIDLCWEEKIMIMMTRLRDWIFILLKIVKVQANKINLIIIKILKLINKLNQKDSLKILNVFKQLSMIKSHINGSKIIQLSILVQPHQQIFQLNIPHRFILRNTL